MNVLRHEFIGDEVYYSRVKKETLIIIYERFYDDCVDFKFQNFKTTTDHHVIDNYKNILVLSSSHDSIRDITLHHIKLNKTTIIENRYFVENLYFVCKFH